MKRGCDHHWEIRRYIGDMAWYAHCNCGFEYQCSHIGYNKEEGFITTITSIYPYCPHCGARKKWYNTEPIKINKSAFE